jgi:low temperature requirement protein LtrA
MAFLTSLLGSIVIWLYFATTPDAGRERLSHSRNPGRLARLAYTHIHNLLVAGIVVSAIGDEFTLASPVGPTDATTR